MKDKAREQRIRNKTISYEEHLKEFLSDPQDAKSYLKVTFEEFLEDGDLNFFLLSLRDYAKAKGGIAKLARNCGLSRESLYKTLSGKGNPEFKGMINILKALGLKLVAKT